MASSNSTDSTSNNVHTTQPNNETVQKLMASNFRKLQKELEEKQQRIEQAEKERAEFEAFKKQQMEDQQKLQNELKMNQERLGTYIEQDKKRYKKLYHSEVEPFLKELSAAPHIKDSEIEESIATVNQQFNNGLENAFMDKDSQNTFQVIRAVASANAMKSSQLEKLFATSKEYQKKTEDLKSEHQKQLEEFKKSEAEKASEIEALKKELEQIRNKHAVTQGSINNVESHFSNNNDPHAPVDPNAVCPLEATNAPPAIAATASSSANDGYSSLFHVTPSMDWRPLYGSDAQESMMGLSER